MQDQSFILGVNYWPRRKAMHWWSQFEAGELREEFEIIAELGLTLYVPPEVYYQAPLAHARRLCREYLGAGQPDRT